MKFWFFALMTLLLTGCATKAYRAVEAECAPQAWVDYPENKVQVMQTRQRVIHVSTGMRSCYSTRDGTHISTICNDITRPEYIPYQELVVIDQNEAVRKSAIASCAAHICVQRYGNAKCKTDQLLVPLQATEPTPIPLPIPQSIPLQ